MNCLSILIHGPRSGEVYLDPGFRPVTTHAQIDSESNVVLDQKSSIPNQTRPNHSNEGKVNLKAVQFHMTTQKEVRSEEPGGENSNRPSPHWCRTEP